MPRIIMERSGEMEVFLRVVEKGGFSAAARSLDLTPSAVSKLIARLEARLGTRLLARTTRALTLTDEGQTYFRAATRVVHELDDADQAVGGDGALRGRLVINASLPFGTAFVAPAVPAFVARHPDIIVDLSVTDEVVNLLAQKADIAFRVGNLPDSALTARKLGQSPRIVCASPAYLARRGIPRVPADLRAHDCLGFNFRRSRSGWPFRGESGVIEVPVSGSVLVNNGETLRQMARAGVGIARLGAWHVAEDIARGDLVPVLEAFNPGDPEAIHAVYLGGSQLPRRVRAFVDHIAEAVAASPLLARR